MFEITSWFTVGLAALLTLGAAWAAARLGPRCVWEGNAAIAGFVLRVLLMVWVVFMGVATMLLVVNHFMLTVTNYGDLSAFIYLLGF